MTYIRHFILLIAILIATTPLHAEPVQFENLPVERVEVQMMNLPEGAAFDPSSVTARIKIKNGAVFSQTDFDNDLKTLVRDYDHVEPTLNVVNGKLNIILKVWPRPTIRSINWCGNHKMKTKKLQEELGIKACTIFDRQAFNTSFHKLKAYYVKNGFFEAALDYNTV